MRISWFTKCPLLALPLLFISAIAQARDPEIRLYKLTHDGHSVKYSLFGKGDNPGCHNTPYRYTVYKVSVIGFSACSVYAEKDCKPASILPAYWKQKEGKKSTEMKPGTRWFLALDGSEVDIASWSCDTGPK